MFKKFTNNIVKSATDVAKDEINNSIRAQFPFVLGAITICVTILTIAQEKKVKNTEPTSITINNYFYR